ncbi:sensor histidine kinase [Salmonirosea aquatica]|uniref:Sensor protein lytS n=1 Tax=Salmonirosea aquatica TaxID=2654236 RepID=A0A7C9BLJ4_9BACT|nr:sensor protein lytS [Cytophagaceae bacterium SJW1-29]
MKAPPNDTRLRLLGPLGLFVFVGVFFRLDWYFQLPFKTILINDTIALIAGLVSWQIARWVVLRIQKNYPGLANSPRRLLWLLAVLPVLANFAWVMRHAARFLIDGKFLYFNNTIELSRTIGIQLFYHFIYFTVYEVWYILRQWHRETVETNALEKTSLQSQLSSLQHQVNPHFLFNSLNSLSSLIGENPHHADAFLEELTSVFRYLLQASERYLVTLGEEVTFIHSYGHLLQARYQQGIRLELDIDHAYESLAVAPLTLQILVENAVRYNVTLPEQPLHIRIFTTPERRLGVANTLQRRSLRVETTGGGLTNLTMRYALLNEGELLIEEQPEWFLVSVPLISKTTVEATN